MEINKKLIQDLFDQAVVNPRLRQNLDMRTSTDDNSQRMLNALMPGTQVAIHRHPQSNENVVCLCGKLVEVLYDEDMNETTRYMLDPIVGNFGCVVPKGVWHTVEVLEPSVIFEAKDGAYGKDGSENFGADLRQSSEAKMKNEESVPESCLGDLKKQITYLIGMERQSGSMEVITPIYVARMLNVPLEEVEAAMKELGLI